MQYCSLQNQTTFTATISATKHHFRFGPVSSFFLEQYFSSSPVAYWTPTDPGSLILRCHILSPFHTVYGVLKARILKWFATPFFSGPCFARTLHHDPSILGGPLTAWLRASLSYPRLWAMWSFWIASYDCGFHSGFCGIVVLASCCLLDEVKRLVQASWWEGLAVGNTGSWSDGHGHAQFSSVQSVMSDSLQPHGLQHARLPSPSPTPGVYSNSCPLSRRCHPTISSCHPLLLTPSIFPSIIVFSNESALRIRWLKYWIFRFNISPSNEYSGRISFRMDWLDLLPVQGTLESLLQHSSKTLILRCSAFFTVQLSYPYMTTGKTIALTRWTFVGKVMSLLFNMLSRLVITFLPRSKCLLLSWLQSPFAVIL